jgi:16S rRNA G527 N7-methylase RsmG
VESRRRCSFLKEIVRENRLATRVKVLQRDAKAIELSDKRFDAVASRAFLPPCELLNIGYGIAAPGGRIVVMGSCESWLEGMEASGVPRVADLELRTDRGLILPGGNERRRIFRFARK